MFRRLNYFSEYRDWRMIAFAGVLGVAIALAMIEIIDLYSASASSISLALAAVVGGFGICLVGSLSAWRIRQSLSEQNLRLDVALNNINQGLCMFDAQNQLVVWNERYRELYDIDPEFIYGADVLFAICLMRELPPERFRLTRRAMTRICARRLSRGKRLPSPSI